MGMISISLIWMLLQVVISELVFVFELGCVSQTICFRVLYNTWFVITMTLRWCNLFANHLWNVLTYDMLCWITVILVVCKLVWNPSRFQLTTGFIWTQVREFDHFGDYFCTCALINWTVLRHTCGVVLKWNSCVPKSTGATEDLYSDTNSNNMLAVVLTPRQLACQAGAALSAILALRWLEPPMS